MTVESKQPREQTLRFKAEVKQLLDIVVHSLYTDREIFVRELISNASDALEKIRHLMLLEKNVVDPDLPLEIRIETDEVAGTFVIRDTGLGMTREEVSKNLGTIAHSGSREFLKAVAEGKPVDATLIGQFGVGFYSSFMVAEEVTVHSRSWRPDAAGAIWRSSGGGSFHVAEVEGLDRGTKVTIRLREDAREYARAERVKELIRRYSSFVPFPVFVNGEQVNTVGAIWTRSPGELTEEDYKGFYRFIANTGGDPLYWLHFNADAPLAIRAVLFVPGDNLERFGLGRMEPGVHLYCKRVLIQQQVDNLLPDYFRFFRGVVDSEDLPLNISRETMQDSALVAKLRKVLTGRLIKFLAEKAKEDPEGYAKFFRLFGPFLKEGVYTDGEHREELAALLRFPSSKTEGDAMTSLDEAIARMPEDQKALYVISGPSREAIEAGPYIEALRERGWEVLYGTDGIDDFVWTALREYKGKKVISADQADLELPGGEEADRGDALPEAEAGDLARWMKEVVGGDVEEVRVSSRLVNSPAVLVNPDQMMTTGMRRVMQAMSRETLPMGAMILEINPRHTILKRINSLRKANVKDDLAREATRLLLDNARIAAGLLVDPRTLVERSTHMLEAALAGSTGEHRTGKKNAGG